MDETFESEREGKREQSRLLGRVFGYMALGLGVTAIVSLIISLIFAGWISKDPNNPAIGNVYLGLVIGSGIALLIDTLVMHFVMLRGKHSLWVPYILYTALMGIFLSSFVLAGVDFWVFAEAFGLTALVFLIMFFIGYFSPANLNILGMVALGLLFSFLFIGGFFGLFYLIAGNVGAYYWYEFVASIVLAVFILIIVAVDGYNIKKISQQGAVSNNLALYMAFSMYTDFISIFIRILYLLLVLKNKN
jgi:FtsH-binding integral membrane protein